MSLGSKSCSVWGYRWCPDTFACSVSSDHHSVVLGSFFFFADFQHFQIISDYLPDTVLFYVQLTCDHSNDNRRSLNITCSTSALFVEGLPLSSHLSFSRDPLWTSSPSQKDVYMTWCYLYTLPEVFQEILTEFSPTGVKVSVL